jgi:hypothetical protein
MSGLTYVAQLPWSLLVPSVYGAIGEVSVGLSASLQGNLAVNASLQASPPTIESVEQASEDFTAAVETALSPEWLVPPLTPPLPQSFTLSDVVSLQASLSASLNVALPALNALLLAAAGIYSFGFVGIGTGLGTAVTTELATTWPDGNPTSGACTALVIGAATPPVHVPPLPDPRPILSGFLSGITFSSGLVYAGKIGVSAMAPLVAPAAAQGSLSIGAALTAAASLSVAAALPAPTFAMMLENQAKFFANLLKVPLVPSPSVAISATAAAAANISAQFGPSCSLGATLGQNGAAFFCYLYTGAANGLGPALTSALGSTWGDGSTSSAGACAVAVLGATDALTIATLTGFFNGV